MDRTRVFELNCISGRLSLPEYQVMIPEQILYMTKYISADLGADLYSKKSHANSGAQAKPLK